MQEKAEKQRGAGDWPSGRMRRRRDLAGPGLLALACHQRVTRASSNSAHRILAIPSSARFNPDVAKAQSCSRGNLVGLIEDRITHTCEKEIEK
jgi:hypothetical protein